MAIRTALRMRWMNAAACQKSPDEYITTVGLNENSAIKADYLGI
jgi:hypothetical protein